MLCEKLFPTKRWKSCNMAVDIDRVKDLKKHQTENSSFFQRFKPKCCLYTLHVAELPLLKWNVDNPHLKHVVEIYLAYLCYYMIYKYPNSEELKKNANKKDLYRLTFSRHLEFLKKHWMSKTNDTGSTGKFIRTVSLDKKKCLEFIDNFKLYLTHYLEHRRIPQDVLNSEHLDFSFYRELFEEYFTERSCNLICRWGDGDFLDPAYNKIFVTTHTRPQCDACVGFVCYINSTNKSRRPKMQGIVSCPFYRAAFSNQEYILGSANTILHHMHEKLQGELLEVDPILFNTAWRNRLSSIDFIVDTHGQHFKNTDRKKRKTYFESVCESDSDSD